MTIRRWLPPGLLALGLVLLTTWAGAEIESRAYQLAGERSLSDSMRAVSSRAQSHDASPAVLDVPAGPARPRVAGPTGSVMGRLEIPRLRISAIVAEGSDVTTLRHAVGHIPSTAQPGSPGNCALAGHRDTFLRGLGDVRVDDFIDLVTPGRTYRYQVVWSAVVEPRQVEVLDPTASPSLTLVTCYPFAYVGPAPRRFVVRAKQVAELEDPVVQAWGVGSN